MLGNEERPEELKEGLKEESHDIKEQEHREQIRRELDETKQEKRKAAGFLNKIKKGIDLRKKAMFGGKFTHGTRGKPSH